MPRAYKSELRDAQTVEMRERLINHAAELLEAEGSENLTLPRLAVRAGVSVPTVYRYFATLDELLRAVLDWLRPRVGMTPENLTRADPATLPHDNFPLFDTHARILEPLMESRAWNRVRVASQTGRADRGAAMLVPHAPHLSPAERGAAAGAVMLFASPIAWRWLRDTWGISSARAADGAAWAMRTLLGELRTTQTLKLPKLAKAPKPTKPATAPKPTTPTKPGGGAATAAKPTTPAGGAKPPTKKQKASR